MDVSNQSLVCRGDWERLRGVQEMLDVKCGVEIVREPDEDTVGDVVDVAEGISILPLTSLRGESSYSKSPNSSSQ